MGCGLFVAAGFTLVVSIIISGQIWSPPLLHQAGFYLIWGALYSVVLIFAAYSHFSERRQSVLATTVPKTTLQPEETIQTIFDRLYIDASSATNVAQVIDSGEKFTHIRRYIIANMADKKIQLSATEFKKLEEAFHLNWIPSFRGWERRPQFVVVEAHTIEVPEDLTTVIAADTFLNDVLPDIFGWESLQLSVSLIEYAVKHNNDNIYNFDSIRKEVAHNYQDVEAKKAVVRAALGILTAYYDDPNVHATHKSLVERIRNSL